jgi:transcriptional regulator with XRE-family HTH domain
VAIPKGSRRIPSEFRYKVHVRIQATMKPYIKANGEWAECCEASHSLKLSPHTVYGWWTGRSLPSIYNLVRFADLYEVSLDYLFGRLNEKSITVLRQAVNETRKAMAA